MNFNVDSLKEKFNSFKQNKTTKATGGGGNKDWFWSSKDETKYFRLLAFPDGELFKEYSIHYGLDVEDDGSERGKDSPFLCPWRNFGEDNPIHKWANELWNDDESTEEHKNLAKKLWPTQRFIFAGLERGRESDGPKLWSVSNDTFSELVQDFVLNDEWGDFVGEKAHDVKVTAEMKRNPNTGQSFKITNVGGRPTKTKLCPPELEKDCAALQDAIPNPDDIFRRVTTAQCNSILETFMAKKYSHLLEEKSDKESKKYGSRSKEELQKKFDDAKAKAPDDEDIPF